MIKISKISSRQIQFLFNLKVHDFFYKIRKHLLFLFHIVNIEKMFSIEIEDKRDRTARNAKYNLLQDVMYICIFMIYLFISFLIECGKLVDTVITRKQCKCLMFIELD